MNQYFRGLSGPKRTLARLLFILAVLMNAGLLSGSNGCGGSKEPTICTSDSDCSEGRQCADGECVAPVPDTTVPPWDTCDDSNAVDLGPGCPCTNDSDCEKGLCGYGPAGTKVCTDTCNTQCPEGWRCSSVDTGTAELETICVSLYADLCKPCVGDSECGLGSAECVDYGEDGRFCGVACGSDSDCPDNYACYTGGQCQPINGMCDCSQKAIDEGATTECYTVEEVGSCAGERHCSSVGLTDCTAPTPTEEVCDGLDNNCNGVVDEELVPPPTDMASGPCVGQFKSCDGAAGWIEGDYTGLEHYENNETLCDNIDNDCDGTVDNLASAPPAYWTEGVCSGLTLSCDGTNGWKEPDYSLLLHYEAEETLCDNLDNDCDGAVDESYDLDTDVANCGACNVTCSFAHGAALCENGTCSLGECLSDYDDCDGSVSNGCETAVNTLSDCAGCGVVCELAHASETCGTGSCTLTSCDVGYGDCDGVQSNGCEVPLFNDVSNCLACGNQCQFSHAVGACTTTGCQIAGCESEYVDLNENEADGCESLISSGADLPDGNFLDTNCDGIDGDIAGAIFVSSSGDDQWAGSTLAPVKTVTQGIALASASGKDVYVAGGNYTSPVTIVLANGVSIYGGYNKENWSRSDSDLVTINVSHPIAVSGNNLSASTVLDRLKITGGDGISTSKSTYGVLAVSSNGLTISNCEITAGSAYSGGDGTSVFGSALGGNMGAQGGSGCEDDTLWLCGSCTRPDVGEGGTNTSCLAANGGRGGSPAKGNNWGGSGGSAAAGAPGGSGVPAGLGNSSNTGHTGASGANGLMGGHGTGCGHAYASGGYSPTSATSGQGGGHGGGAGGGGGGGGGFSGCDSYGGGGGGGGGGGCGGAAGGKGTNGGAVFALYFWNSNATVQDNVLRTGSGGAGGDGGVGQYGGSGGAGGAGSYYGGSSEQDDGSNGGSGGHGGHGGRGGHGGGGCGGSSIGILLGGTSSPTQAGNSYFMGSAGAGGEAGGSPGASGYKMDHYIPL